MNFETFLCALAVAVLAFALGFAYGFLNGCRYGGAPAAGGKVPGPDSDKDRPE